MVQRYNEAATQLATLQAYVYATVSTDTRHEQAQSLLSEVATQSAKVAPLLARLADWVNALDPARWPSTTRSWPNTSGRCSAWPSAPRTR